MRPRPWWLLLLVACEASPPPTPAPEPSRETSRTVEVAPALVEAGRIATAAAELRSPQDDLTVSGEVVAAPDAAARLSANLPGRLRAIRVEEGDHVEADEILAELNTPAVARLRADLASARARRKQAEAILQQEQRLLDSDATSARSVLRAEREVAEARARESSSSRQLAAAGHGEGGIVVRSPIAGIVTHRAAILGVRVTPDDVLFHVVDPDGLHVLAHVPASVAATVGAGTRVTVEPPASAPCPGRVIKSVSAAERRGRSIGYRVALDEPTCGGLVVGGYVDVTLHRKHEPNPTTVAVPRDAVVDLDGVPVVFLVGDEPGHFTVQTVRLASTTSHTAYVDDGLADGQRVVSRGAILLKGEWMRAALE